MFSPMESLKHTQAIRFRIYADDAPILAALAKTWRLPDHTVANLLLSAAIQAVHRHNNTIDLPLLLEVSKRPAAR
jgi:HD-like signal output (HDOD) protein